MIGINNIRAPHFGFSAAVKCLVNIVKRHPVVCSTACSGMVLYFLNKYLQRRFDRLLTGLQDRRGLNKLITFGEYESCGHHFEKDYDCGDMTCNYGKFSYLLKLIDNAEKSVDVCMYIMSANGFIGCLVDAKKRGLRVRVISDADTLTSGLPYLSLLRKYGIPVRFMVSPYIMHHKYVIIDDEVLLTGSLNFTMTAIHSNLETVMVTSQVTPLSAFITNFAGLWDEFDPRRQQLRKLTRTHASRVP